jgi:hypothetical protein
MRPAGTMRVTITAHLEFNYPKAVQKSHPQGGFFAFRAVLVSNLYYYI